MYFSKEIGLGILSGLFVCPRIADIKQYPPTTKKWTKEKMIASLIIGTKN